MKITKDEASVIRAIATNCHNYCNYGIPESYEEAADNIWSASINDAKYPSGLIDRSLSGVCGSLIKKGFCLSCGCGSDSTIKLTKNGYDKMISYFGENLSDRDNIDEY